MKATKDALSFNRLLFEQSKHPVVDIGCAYGVSIFPILEDAESSCEVVALDDCQEHLDILKENVSELNKKRLITIKANKSLIEGR